MTTRRGFLASLLALPVVAKLLPKKACPYRYAYGAYIIGCDLRADHGPHHSAKFKTGGRDVVFGWNDPLPYQTIYISKAEFL